MFEAGGIEERGVGVKRGERVCIDGGRWWERCTKLYKERDDVCCLGIRLEAQHVREEETTHEQLAEAEEEKARADSFAGQFEHAHEAPQDLGETAEDQESRQEQ